MKDVWRVWDDNAAYGEVLYKRAVGDAPQMESSKAVANQLEGILRAGSHVLDAGCGAGHYLRSLRAKFEFDFEYVGMDATQSYIELARKAFTGQPGVEFHLGDLYDIPFDSDSFDVVMCSNVLLHLPSILGPLRELWRVTRYFLLVRTLVGQHSHRIKWVKEPGDVWDAGRLEETASDDPLFDVQGEPRSYFWYNIYSEKYVSWCFSCFDDVAGLQILEDLDFLPHAIGARKWPGKTKPPDVTETYGGRQVAGHVVQPWAFIRAFKERA